MKAKNEMVAATRRGAELCRQYCPVNDRIGRLLRKVVEHADGGMEGSESYARDRLKVIRDLAAYGVERVIGEGCDVVD